MTGSPRRLRGAFAAALALITLGPAAPATAAGQAGNPAGQPGNLAGQAGTAAGRADAGSRPPTVTPDDIRFTRAPQ